MSHILENNFQCHLESSYWAVWKKFCMKLNTKGKKKIRFSYTTESFSILNSLKFETDPTSTFVAMKP